MKVRHELRNNNDGTLDEFLVYVDKTCVFHLEQMDDGVWWMAGYSGNERTALTLCSEKTITAVVQERLAGGQDCNE